MKKILSVILVLAMVLAFSSCSKSGENKTTMNIGVLKGPTGLGTVQMMENDANGEKYSFTVAGAADELTGRLVSGDLDIAMLPTNAIATLYNKTGGDIVCLGVNTLGVLYILENGNSINSVSDLEGKIILSSGKGSIAEHVLSIILSENNVNAEIFWATEHTEAVTLALTGEYDIVMLPEPFVTNLITKDGSFRVALGLTEEWFKISDGTALTMGGVAVRKAFLDEHPDAVKAFVEDYEKSVTYTCTEPAEAAKLAEKYDIIAAAVAENAIPRCHIVWLHGNSYKDTLNKFLSEIYEVNPMLIGENIPGDDFYAKQ